MADEPSAESSQEVHVHGKNPKVNVIPHEEDPGCRRDGRQVLEYHIPGPLVEDACSERVSGRVRGEGQRKGDDKKAARAKQTNKHTNKRAASHLI